MQESNPAPVSGDEPDTPPVNYAAYPREQTNSLYKPFNCPPTGVDPNSPEEVRKGKLHRRIIVIAFILGFVAYFVIGTIYSR